VKQHVPKRGGGGGFEILFWLGVKQMYFHVVSSQVPYGYLLCSQFVPQVPNRFPITTPLWLYPICFAQSPCLVNYICSTKENNNIIWLWIILICSLISHFLVRNLKYWDIKSSPWQKLKFQKIFLLLKS